MPARNVVKDLAAHQYYHVYNRGVAKQKIFLDQSDKQYFLGLIDRHLNPANTKRDGLGVPYRKFDSDLEMLSFCLMGNHFHFLIYQLGAPTALSDFMRSIGIAYTMYFNRKYKRVGPLFQGIYKASRVSNDAYLLHISRYIHLNPREYRTYRYSSLQAYLGNVRYEWVKPKRILDLFDGINYLSFMEDYEGHKNMLEEVKHELADH